MADIDTGAFDKAQQQQFRMEQAQGMGVYLPQFNEYVQANASDTPTSLNYKYSTALGGKPRSDYFGMVELNRFENAIEKKEGMADVFFGSDTRRSVPVTLVAGSIKSFMDTVVNKPLKLAYSLGTDVKGYAKYFGEAPSEIRMVDYYNPISNKMEKRDSRVVSMNADFVKAMDNYHAVENSIYSKPGLVTEKKESELAQGVADVIGSLGASFGLGGYGIALFAAGSGGDVYEELRTKGVSPATALPVATAVGGAVGILEKFNMDKIANRVVYKSMTTLLAKQGAVEAGTEMAQTGAEALITSPWRDDTALDVIRDVMTDGFYGFLGGVFGHAINNTRYKEEIQKSQKKLRDAGFTEQDSKVIVNNAYSGNENMAKLVETINSQTQQLMDMDGNGDFDADKLKAQWDMFVDQEAVGLDDTTYNAVLDFQNGIYEDVIAQGKTEEEAESASTFARSMINAITREANEAGLDVQDAVKSAMVNILYSEGKVKYVDEQGQEVSAEEYDFPGDRKPQEGGVTYDEAPFFSLGVEEIAERKKIYKAFGEYAPISKTIELFKGNRSDTLTHEMGHHFFPIYIDLLVKNKKFDEVNKILNAVGATDVNNITREQWEGIVELGIKYLNTNEAPNVATRNMFRVAKDWMIDVYHTVAKKKDAVSPEVKDFFDNIIANDEASVPDINYLKAKGAEINKVLNEFAKGKEIITESGLTISDVENLRKALYARIPRQGRTLDTDIRSAGGIDVNSAMAKQLGYDSRRGSEGGFWVKNGAIKNEQDLLEFLSSKEYINKPVGETYDETSDIWNQVENLIYNKEQAMNVKETEQQAKYENAIEASRIAQEMLAESGIKNIREFENKLRTVRDFVSSNDKTYIKDALRYVQRSMKKINNDYNRLVNSDIAKAERKAANNARITEKERQVKQKEYVEALKKTYKDFVRSLPVNSELSAKLLAKADSIKTDITLNNMLENAKERAGEFVNKEVYKTLSKEIDSLVSGSMFKNANKGKYDFESAKIFRELRNYSKLNRTQAEEEFELYRNTDPQDFESRLVKNYLYYKAYGDKVSRSGMVDLYDGMRYLAETAKQAKDEQDLQAKLNKQANLEKTIKSIQNRKYNKDNFAYKFESSYLDWGGANLDSRLKAIIGPEFAKQFEMETVVEAQNIKTNRKIANMIDSFLKIYKLKSKYDAIDMFTDMSKEGIDVIKPINGYTASKLSKFDIMDMYLQMLNEERREYIYKTYSKESIEGSLGKLSDADKKFARSMQADIQGLWEDVNAQYFKQKGKDMGFIKNYWMATSDINAEADMYNTFRTSATSPSATKSRAGFGVVPNFENAWSKYNKYIANAIWYTNTGQQWQDLTNMINNPEVSKAIKEKYGSKILDNLVKSVNDLGISGLRNKIGSLEAYFGKMISNYVGAKVSLNPVVLLGQLTSFTNYAENMNIGEFSKVFTEGVANPKETIAYMNKYAGEFLKNRFSESGFDEQLKSLAKEAGDFNKKTYGIKGSKKKMFSDAITVLVKTGDIGAIIFGGYPRLKNLIDSGMPLAEAQRQFIYETLRSQQSSNVASLTEIQKNKGFGRLFTSFKNTPYQYSRKIADALIAYNNGDISGKQCAKIITMYGIIQPVIWTVATNSARKGIDILLGDDDDDEKEITDNVIQNMLITPIGGLPFVSEVFNSVSRHIEGKKGVYRGMTQHSIGKDIEKSFSLLDKEDKTLYNYVEIISPYIEMAFAAPTGTALRWAKKMGYE